MTTSQVPDTSTTLLRDVADSQHARWAVFHSRYEPMMRSFMNERFPSLDADDIIQETFIALVKALPHYVYSPKENGHFHNYLTGVLRNKALKALAVRQRDAILREKAALELEGRRPLLNWKAELLHMKLITRSGANLFMKSLFSSCLRMNPYMSGRSKCSFAWRLMAKSPKL